MTTEFEPLPILDALTRHGVAFVVIGGYAATLHASPFITYDVDVTPERSVANLERLSEALRDLDARVRTADHAESLPFAHTGASLAGAMIWNLTTRYGDLDVSFVPNGTQGYDDLIRDAQTVEIHGVEVRIASLADIIRSKQAANRPKDQRVLPTLREILASRNPRNAKE
jgi:hypothetical protein